MTVRAITKADYSAWHALWVQYLTFYKTDLSAEVTERAWQRLLDENEPMLALGAFDATGDLWGFAHFVYHRSFWTIGDYCYLQDLFTAPERRRQGVAKALITAVYGKARSAGASRVYWLTHETNSAAQNLYERVAVRTGAVQYRKVLSL